MSIRKALSSKNWRSPKLISALVLVLVAFLISVRFAYVDPRSVIVPLTNPKGPNLEFDEAMGQLSEEERQLIFQYILSQYLIAAQNPATKLPSVSIKQALAEQRRLLSAINVGSMHHD